MSRKTRKLMWSVPLIAAVAVIGALAAFMTLTPNDASAQNVGIPPGQPTNLTVVPYADTIPEEELLLTWTEPTDGGSVRQYRIDISHNGGYTWVALESDFRNNSYTHAGLEASTTLHYRVFAVNQHGVSPVSNVGGGTTDDSTVPDRPNNLTATVGSSSGDHEATSTGDLTITPHMECADQSPGRAGQELYGRVFRRRLPLGPGSRREETEREAHWPVCRTAVPVPSGRGQLRRPERLVLHRHR